MPSSTSAPSTHHPQSGMSIEPTGPAGTAAMIGPIASPRCRGQRSWPRSPADGPPRLRNRAHAARSRPLGEALGPGAGRVACTRWSTCRPSTPPRWTAGPCAAPDRGYQSARPARATVPTRSVDGQCVRDQHRSGGPAGTAVLRSEDGHVEAGRLRVTPSRRPRLPAMTSDHVAKRSGPVNRSSAAGQVLTPPAVGLAAAAGHDRRRGADAVRASR